MKLSSDLRSLLVTLLLATLTTLFLMQRHMEIGLILVIFFMFIWFFYSLFIIIKDHSKLILQTKKLAIWLMAIFIVIASHYDLHVSTRQYAQEVANKVNTYADKHGSYPQNLEAVGINNAQLKAKLGMSAYIMKDGKPSFFYRTTYVPFEIDSYDFKTRQWRHISD